MTIWGKDFFNGTKETLCNPTGFACYDFPLPIVKLLAPVHYRTESLCGSCSLLQWPANRPARRERGHQEACWDRAGVLEAAREQPQTQPKEAEIAAILSMQPFEPPILQRTDTQIDEPEIGQTGCDQQPAEPFRVAEVTLVDMKAARFT